MAANEAPKYPVRELIAECYEVLGIPRHVAVGAVTLAGIALDGELSMVQFKACIEAFLKYPME